MTSLIQTFEAAESIDDKKQNMGIKFPAKKNLRPEKIIFTGGGY
jgi:hypothetical protein